MISVLIWAHKFVDDTLFLALLNHCYLFLIWEDWILQYVFS